MNNLNWKHLLALLIICGAITMVAGMFSSEPTPEDVAPAEISEEQTPDKSSEEQTPAEISEEQTPDTYVNDEEQVTDRSLREEYVNGCLGEGVTRAYCNCTYNYMVDQVGIDGFLDQVAQFNQTGQFSDLMLDAVDECLHLL